MMIIRTRWLKFWWRWDKGSKPESALDVRVLPSRWLRLFYFRHRPKWWYEHSVELTRGWGQARKGRILFDGPSMYDDVVESAHG